MTRLAWRNWQHHGFIIAQCTEQNWQRSQSINICARSITSLGVCCYEMDSKSQTDDKHPGGRCLYAPSKRFLQLIAYEVWCSAHRSTALLNSSAFDVIWMEKLTPTKCILTEIQQRFLSVRKMGIKQYLAAFWSLKFNSTKVWRGNTLFHIYYMNLTFITLITSLFWTTLTSFIHFYIFSSCKVHIWQMCNGGFVSVH